VQVHVIEFVNGGYYLLHTNDLLHN